MLLDPRVPHAFVPPDQLLRPEAERVTYLIQVPGQLDRIAFSRGLAEIGARRIGYGDLNRLMARAIEEALAPFDPETAEAARAAHAGYEAELARWREACLGHSASTPEGQQAIMAAMERQVRAAAIIQPMEDALAAIYPAFAAARGDFVVYQQLRGLVAARLFLRGWENVGLDFRRGLRGVPDSLLDALPQAHIDLIGHTFERLLSVTEEQARNFGSRSRSPSTPAISPTGSSTTATTRRKKRPGPTPKSAGAA